MKKILLFLSILVSTGVHAFIYQAKVLRKYNSELGTYQYVFGLGDFHDKKNSANAEQRAHIEALLHAQGHEQCKIVVEDLTSANNLGNTGCGNFSIQSTGGFLGGLAHNCKDSGFDVDNVEYRYCRVAALGPVLNNPEKDVNTIVSATQTSVNELAQEVIATLAHVEEFHDGQQAHKEYKKCIKEVKPQLKKLKFNKQLQATVAQYLLKNSKPTNRADFLQNLFTFDSALLDIKFMHAVLNTQKPNVFVFAGGAHVDRMSTMLQNIGYEVVHDSDVQVSQEFDLKKCIGSNIVDGAYCLKPEPIGLDFFDHFL